MSKDILHQLVEDEVDHQRILQLLSGREHLKHWIRVIYFAIITGQQKMLFKINEHWICVIYFAIITGQQKMHFEYNESVLNLFTVFLSHISALSMKSIKHIFQRGLSLFNKLLNFHQISNKFHTEPLLVL